MKERGRKRHRKQESRGGWATMEKIKLLSCWVLSGGRQEDEGGQGWEDGMF